MTNSAQTETFKDLSGLFAPASVAIVGASTDDKKLGNIVLRNIIDSGYTGKLFPVNPKAQAVRGISCFAEYQDLPGVPDLAIVAIPAHKVLQATEEIARKGTKNILIFTAGFKESGAEGAELELALQKIAREHDLLILGPNCLGFVSTAAPINATFGQLVKHTGALRFITQSGAIATSIFDWSDHTTVGFTDFITLGNKAVLHESDILEYWLHIDEAAGVDSSVAKSKSLSQLSSNYHPLGMYLESIEDGARFVSAVHQMSLQNPVFVLKPGKSAAAVAAMQSHTGALAGDDQVFSAALRKAGAIRCAELEDMFDLSRAFAWTAAPRGTKVAIISNAGGPAVITSDAVMAAGLNLAELDADTKRTLEKHLPRAASIKNPIDVLGDALAERYHDAIETVLQADQVDALIIILTPQVMTQIAETAEVIGQLSRQYHKPILCSFMGGSLVAKGEEVLNQYQIPSFRFPERAVKALATMWQWYDWQQKELKAVAAEAESGLKAESKSESEPDSVSAKASSISQLQSVAKPLLKSARAAQAPTLDGFAMEQLLTTAGVAIPASLAIQSAAQAHEFAARVGYPVVLKLIGAQLLHKTEHKAVLTSIKNEAELDTALNQLVQTRRSLPQPRSITIQIQEQVKSGLELLVGIKTDPQFGRVMLVGSGGQLAELMADHQLLVLPATAAEFRVALTSAKFYPILRGYRGGREYSIKQLVQTLQRFADIALAVPELAELEINPLILNASGMYAVDGKGVLASVE